MNRLERENVRLNERITDLKTQIKELYNEYKLAKEREASAAKEIRELKESIMNYESNSKKERIPRTTLGQKIVLLNYFKISDFINQIVLDQTLKYKLLGYILDAHEKNVAIDYNSGSQEDSKLNNTSNNKFLVKVFQELKMKEAENWAQQRLNKN